MWNTAITVVSKSVDDNCTEPVPQIQHQSMLAPCQLIPSKSLRTDSVMDSSQISSLKPKCGRLVKRVGMSTTKHCKNSKSQKKSIRFPRKTLLKTKPNSKRTIKIHTNASQPIYQKNISAECKINFSLITRQDLKDETLEKFQNSALNNNAERNTSFSPSSSLANETDTNKSNTFTHCFVCNIGFENVYLLQKHKESTKLFCRNCTEEFSQHSKLESHFMSHKPFKCRNCSKLFLSRKDLFQHRDKNNVCNLKVSCNFCNKSFYEERCLKLHRMKFHSGSGEVHKCIVCGKSFNILRMLNEHLKRIHMGYENLECKICSALMWGPDRLKQHMKATHIDPAQGDSFICSVCRKIYNTKALLRQHMETHDTTVRLCELCGKSVTGVTSMRRHMLRDHSKSGFTCKVCKEHFGQLNEMRKHVKQHQDPVDESVFCEVCGKKFKSPNTLKVHLMIHSEEKLYGCDVCGARFKQMVTLRTHQRVHSDVGKYFCNSCGTSFRWKQTFDKHINKCESAAPKT